MNKICCAIALMLLSFSSFAQKEYAGVDEKVEALGPLDSFNIATIADTIARKFTSNEHRARGIFYWIANNISHDLKATKSNDNRKSDPVSVIRDRKATPLGYSLLIQEMMSMANIRCLSVDGYVKRSSAEINNPADEFNHAWNVVQLGQSPDQWHYIDAFKAAGYTDARFTKFTPSFTSQYFFADRSLFNLDHFPDNSAWQLGSGPKTKKDFYALPIVYNKAYPLNIGKPSPATGYVKAKLNKAVTFSFNVDEADAIQSVTLITGDEKKPDKPQEMNFTRTGGGISFTHQFKKDDEYPVRILVDGEVVLEYLFEVTE